MENTSQVNLVQEKELKEVNPLVLTVDDVKEMLEGAVKDDTLQWLVPKLFKKLSIDKVNDIHKRYCHLRGPEFAHNILKDDLINVSYEIHGKEHLENLPEGSFMTISNHPFGGLDGIILLDVVGHYRPDYRLLVNNFLCKIGAMEDSFIPVMPEKRHKSEDFDPSENLFGLMKIRDCIKRGQPVGMFPAGGISVWSWKKMRAIEQPWKRSSVRIISTAGVPVVPIMFNGQNSFLYHALGMINLKFQVARIPAEVFNKKGTKFDIYVRPAIYPDEWKDIKNIDDLIRFFYDKTFAK